MWLHYPNKKVERLLLLKRTEVDLCSTLEKEMVKSDTGVGLRVQAFCVRRTGLGESLGCRVYNGRHGHQGNNPSWTNKRRPRRDSTALHESFQQARSNPALPSFISLLPPRHASRKPTHVLSRWICQRILKSTGHAINTPQCCLSYPLQKHCYQNGLCYLFLHPLLDRNYIYDHCTLFKCIFSMSDPPGA